MNTLTPCGYLHIYNRFMYVQYLKRQSIHYIFFYLRSQSLYIPSQSLYNSNVSWFYWPNHYFTSVQSMFLPCKSVFWLAQSRWPALAQSLLTHWARSHSLTGASNCFCAWPSTAGTPESPIVLSLTCVIVVLRCRCVSVCLSTTPVLWSVHYNLAKLFILS